LLSNNISWNLLVLTLFSFWSTFWIDATNIDTIKLGLQQIASMPVAHAHGVQESPDSVLQWLSQLDHEVAAGF
jgi:hypothetical protein